MKNNNTSTKLVLAIVKAKSGIATGGKYYSVIRNYINKNIFFLYFWGGFIIFFFYVNALQLKWMFSFYKIFRRYHKFYVCDFSYLLYYDLSKKCLLVSRKNAQFLHTIKYTPFSNLSLFLYSLCPVHKQHASHILQTDLRLFAKSHRNILPYFISTDSTFPLTINLRLRNHLYHHHRSPGRDVTLCPNHRPRLRPPLEPTTTTSTSTTGEMTS